ncbi:unnamed protein product, partial [Meganyctiphanes norvegica]
FFWCNSELIVESVMPDLFHVIPVSNDTMFNWVFQGEDTSFALGFISNIGILLTHTNHHTLMPGPANNGGEDGTWCIISSKSGLAHTGAIVHNKSGNFVVTHCDGLGIGNLIFLYGLPFGTQSMMCENSGN